MALQRRDRSVTKRDKPLTKEQVGKIVDQATRIRELEQEVAREFSISREWQKEAERYFKEVKRLMEVMDRIQNGIGGDPMKVARGAFRMGLPNAK